MKGKNKLKKALNNKEYKIILIKILYPPYYDDGITYKKGHLLHKYREYKTWKHNRKNKWK